MGNTQNLSGKDAVRKLRDLTSSSPTCMFESGLGKIPFHTCPMHLQEVDDEGRLWFFSTADSVHNRNVTEDPRTQLVFCNDSKIEYLSVFGETSVSKDRAKIDQLWSNLSEAWFPGGKEDPNLTLLSVSPQQTHYWDTENGKLVTFAKMLTSAFSGSEADVGIEGDLRV